MIEPSTIVKPEAMEALLRTATRVSAPPLCPELRLHLAASLEAVRVRQERMLGRRGFAPAYWAVAWPGGQALARHVLDFAERFRAARVLDLGSGSGLCAIAAARAGAQVEAVDPDAFAAAAIAANARLNCVAVAISTGDVFGAPCRWDVVLAADLWYERFFAQRASAWLRQAAADGAEVLVADSGRAYFPRSGLRELARYAVADPAGVEPSAAVRASVWRMAPPEGRGGEPP